MDDPPLVENAYLSVESKEEPMKSGNAGVISAPVESALELDVPGLLRTLAKRRPIFHSEADFQHALAWEIQRTYPNVDIRLEYRAPKLEFRAYIDIWVRERGGGRRVAIELKYKTRKLRFEDDGEAFTLLDQSAQDLGRYHFLKDIDRLQQVAGTHRNTLGYAVLLTNDRSYWSIPQSPASADAAFRLTDGRKVPDTPLAWGPRAGRWVKGLDPITIRNQPVLRWQDYSEVGPGTYGKFRYLVLEVT